VSLSDVVLMEEAYFHFRYCPFSTSNLFS